MYGVVSDPGRYVLIDASISNLGFEDSISGTPNVHFIILTPGWDITNVNSDNPHQRVTVEIQEVTVELQEVTVEHIEAKFLTVAIDRDGNVSIRIEPKDPSNPPDECWVICRDYEYQSHESYVNADSVTIHF